jgi:hypothetical protein
MSLTPSRGRLFQTLHPVSGFKRLNVSIEKPSHVAGLRRRQITARPGFWMIITAQWPMACEATR